MRCCGKIGQSNKFCWIEQADCEVASHEVKVEVPPGFLFVSVGSDDQKGYCEPCMARSLLMSSEPLHLALEQEKTREDWTSLFEARKTEIAPTDVKGTETPGAASPYASFT